MHSSAYVSAVYKVWPQGNLAIRLVDLLDALGKVFFSEMWGQHSEPDCSTLWVDIHALGLSSKSRTVPVAATSFLSSGGLVKGR